MCGRTVLAASPDNLREVFGLDHVPELRPRYNVPPSQPVAVVRVMRGSPGRARTMDLLRWGLLPPWAEDRKASHKLALARVETVATTPAFRDAFLSRRCLVVVDGFYEWKREGKTASHPYLLRRADGAPFALAGLWERWTARDGEIVESCAILTQPALPPLSEIHDRMPVVLAPDAWDRWLDPACSDVSSLLARRPAELVAQAVSTYVNDPRHDDIRCMEPALEPAQRSLF
jgi:putative SOS response-associated peptidase YedK